LLQLPQFNFCGRLFLNPENREGSMIHDTIIASMKSSIIFKGVSPSGRFSNSPRLMANQMTPSAFCAAMSSHLFPSVRQRVRLQMRSPEYKFAASTVPKRTITSFPARNHVFTSTLSGPFPKRFGNENAAFYAFFF
jgi:hypothetical protein